MAGFLTLVLANAAPAQDPPILELSLEEACARALENSPDIEVERLANQSVELGLREAERWYEPYLTSMAEVGSRREPAQDAFAGGATVDTDSLTWNFGLAQPLKTGASLRLDMQNGREDTTSVYSTFDPGYVTRAQIGLTQPLLRNFRVDEQRQRIRVAKKDREISDLAFREAVLNMTAEVKRRYFNLIYAIDYRDAHARVVEMVRQLQDDNRERVKAGVMPRFDLLLGDSELAAREEALMVAEADAARAEDALKRLVLEAGDLEAWKVRIRPKDRPVPEPVAVDVEAALRAALAQRTDLRAARAGLDRSELARQFAGNQARPALDLSVTYGTMGLGGTKVVRSETGGEVSEKIPGGYGDALSDALDGRHPTWTVGLNLAYPILNRAAKTGVARAQVGRELAAARVAQLEQDVIAEVRDAARAVEIGYGRVQRAQEALAFQKQRLDAEMERFAAGRSTPFFVVQAQRDLFVSALTALTAVVDYRKSQVEFERVQAAGLTAEGFLE
jgi:outer membrane protein